MTEKDKINFNHLIQDKIYYYLNTIGYYPRQSIAFQRLKKNILIEETPEFKEYQYYNTLNIDYIIYTYICGKENLIEISKNDLEYMKIYIETIANAHTNKEINNTFASFVMSQFYHTITLNYTNSENIDETLTYKELQQDMFNNYISEYRNNLNISKLFLKNAINNNSLENCNPHTKFYASQANFATIYDKDEIFKSSVNLQNIENNILFTGNPQAEFEYAQTINNPIIRNRLIISASRVNRLFENPSFDIGYSTAQWYAYNILKKERNWGKYNLPQRDEKVLNSLLRCAAKIDQVLYDKNYSTGNNNALKLYHEILKTKDPKKYKKELKKISKKIEFIKNMSIKKTIKSYSKEKES